jgi:hypothetical protein
MMLLFYVRSSYGRYVGIIESSKILSKQTNTTVNFLCICLSKRWGVETLDVLPGLPASNTPSNLDRFENVRRREL